MDKSIISPILIGRNQELATLEDALNTARQGRGQLLLIAGDAGVGKSRLLYEVATRATAQGVLHIQGHCFEQDTALPCSLWIDALRSHFAASTPDQVKTTFGPFTGDLLNLLPELSTLLPDLRPSSTFDPETQKRRIFDGLAYFFTNIARVQPMLLTVEDAHWSDKSSLDFLHFLIRRTSTLPILLLISYRHHEAPPSLQHFLAQLDRERLAHEIVLAPLTRAEVAQMLGAILQSPRPVQRNFLDAIYAYTEGNAFFVEEILKLLIGSGEIELGDERWQDKLPNEVHIPRSVADSVQQRMRHLSPAAKELLALAAVAGRRFDYALLAALTERSEQAIIALIKELVTSQLVVEESSEQLAFNHALTREAIYASLLRRERKHYHVQITETMARLYASSLDRHLGLLAHHAFEAGLWQQALDYSERAGQQAQSLYAAREAIVHFTRALEAARQMDNTPSAAILRARGKAYETAGDFELARADYDQTLHAAQQANDGASKWQALIDLGFLWSAHDYARTGDYFHRALELARSLNQATLVAHSLNRVGNWYVNVQQPTAALSYHDEALALFAELNERRGLAETYDLLGMTHQLNSDLFQSHRAYQQAIFLWKELQDRAGLVSSLASLPLCAASYLKNLELSAISLRDAVAAAQEARQIAQMIGWRAGEAFASQILAMCLGSQGDYAPAIEAAQMSLRCAEEIEHRQWTVGAHVALGTLHLDLLAYDTARFHLEKALALAKAVGSQVWIGSAVGYLASTYIASGMLEDATALLDEMLPADAPMQMQWHRLSWYARAEVALAVGDATAAKKIVGQLIVSTLNLAQDKFIPRLWLLRGKCLAALGDVDAAIHNLQAANHAATEQDAKSLQWRILIALGKLYQGQTRRGEANESFAAARAAINSLAPKIPAGELRHHFLKQALLMLPSQAVLTPAQIARQNFGGLTTREREIALLVAQGKSNQEIAAELFVGVRTVEAHITRILSKLDFSSRVQIAAWVVERRLS